MKHRILLLSTATLLFTGFAFAQTGNGSDKKKAKDSSSVKKAMPKTCPGKTCGKKKTA